MIGLLGAHRTGKTTLAKAVAKEAGLSFCETNLSQYLRDAGIDPRVGLPLARRLKVQEGMLDYLESVYVAALKRRRKAVITDRTPLDVLAYTAGDINRGNCGPKVDQLFAAHFGRAVQMTGFFFDRVILVQPGIPLVDAEGKAPPSTSYIEHLNLIMLGLLKHRSVTNLPTKLACISRETIDLNCRVNAVTQLLNRDNSVNAEAARTLN